LKRLDFWNRKSTAYDDLRSPVIASGIPLTIENGRSAFLTGIRRRC
jgi:hypothetical protein